MNQTALVNPWFSTTERAGTALFCLPYAGAGAVAFRDWPAAFPAGIEVVPVRLPGREGRIAEPPAIEPVKLADAVAGWQRATGRPFALYGHSMGARIAFEVVRELRRRDAVLPAHCYVAAGRPPDTVEPLAHAARMPDPELADRLVRLGGMPAEVFAEPELRELLLPILRADFGWLDGYRYQPEPPLPVPVTAFAGDEDRDTGPRRMRGWSRHTTGPFRLHVLAGGHFFLRDRLTELAALITADLMPRA